MSLGLQSGIQCQYCIWEALIRGLSGMQIGLFLTQRFVTAASINTYEMQLSHAKKQVSHLNIYKVIRRTMW